MKKAVSPFFCILLCLLLPGAAMPAQPDAAVPGIPGTAPDFARADLEQRQIRLADYRGKVVLLNFWATWCAPCLGEIGRFAQWQRRFGGPGGLQVIGISMDDDPAPVREAYGRFHLNYPVVMGDEQLGEAYGGVLGLPVTFLIDGGGVIRQRHQGAANLDRLEQEIRSLLPHARR